MPQAPLKPCCRGLSMAAMALRDIRASDLQNLDWRTDGDEGWRIEADLTCTSCGAYQAADSDPTTKRETAAALTVRLFNSVGWRADEQGWLLCPDCAVAATDRRA